MYANTEIIHPNVVLHFRVLINQSRFRNPLSGRRRRRRAETNFRRSSSRSLVCVTLLRGFVLSVRYGTRRVLACSLRNACTRCDAGIYSRTDRNSKPRNATGPVRPSSFTGQRTRLSQRYRGCHLLQHWPNHSEKPIDRGPIHFFSSNKPGGHVFLSAIPLGAAIIIGAVVAIHLIARQTTRLLINPVYEHFD